VRLPAITGAAARVPRHPIRRQLRLMRYGRRHLRTLVALNVSMVLTIGVDVLKPFPLKILIDDVLGHHHLPPLLAWLPGADDRSVLLIWAVGGEILIFLLYTVLDMVASYTATALGQRMAYDLGADLFLHVQRLSLRFHANRAVGDTIARVTGDSYAASSVLLDSLLPGAQALISLIAMFVVMWQLQPTLTLLSIAVLPFLLVVIKTLAGQIHARSREQRDLEGAMMSVVQRTLTGIPAVKAFSRERLEHARFRAYADQTVRAYLRATFAGMWFKLGAGLITALGTAAVMYVGARYALDGRLTAGTIVVFISYLSSFYDPLNTLTHMASTLQVSAASADRVIEVLDEPVDVIEKPNAVALDRIGPIRYEHVTFGYELDRPVVRDLCFEVAAGEVLAIVGPTGAGKTTIVNLLMRFFDPWSGRITLNGRDIRDYRLESLRRHIAMVLQDPFLFPLSVAENIAYGRGSRLASRGREPDASQAEIEAAARAANAHEFIMRLPDGYDTIIGEAGATLSGGEKQRLSLARAFLKDAPILILDEPTSALDARTEAQLLDALDRLMAGRIVFVNAHRLSTIRRADQILVLEDGRIVERGAHEQLLARGGAYAELYRTQMRPGDQADAQADGGVAPSLTRRRTRLAALMSRRRAGPPKRESA
jgi:ATP-binding cassette subfamily B protein